MRRGISLPCAAVFLANLGAYLALMGPLPPTNNLGGLAGVYRTPAIFAEVLGAFTHTQPTAPYRGAPADRKRSTPWNAPSTWRQQNSGWIGWRFAAAT